MNLSEVINANMAKAAEDQRRLAAQAHYEFVKAHIISPRVIIAGDVGEVMREQLEALITHAMGGSCGCSVCGRYLQARDFLLEPFADRSDMLAPRALTAKT